MAGNGREWQGMAANGGEWRRMAANGGEWQGMAGDIYYLLETPLLEAALGQITANNTIISLCLLKAVSNNAAPGGLYMEG